MVRAETANDEVSHGDLVEARNPLLFMLCSLELPAGCQPLPRADRRLVVACLTGWIKSASWNYFAWHAELRVGFLVG